jgi:hypothetical protein
MWLMIRAWAAWAVSAPLHSSKEERRAWQTAVTTQHLFYSACEGLTPSLRVSERNEPYKLHGLVCDYDSKISDADLGAIVKRAAPELLPTWTSHTFSGGARLVFEFEKPVYVDNHDLADRFLKELGKEFRLKNLLPGLDDKTFSLTKYFELGRDWRRVPDAKPISSDVLGLLFYRAAGKKTIRGEGPSISIEAVAARVEGDAMQAGQMVLLDRRTAWALLRYHKRRGHKMTERQEGKMFRISRTA